MARYVSFRDFDWLLLGFVLLICGIGVTEIYSATLHTKFAGAHIKQIYWILGGVVLMFAVSLINYQAMLEQVHWMYIASIASLMLVLVFGQNQHQGGNGGDVHPMHLFEHGLIVDQAHGEHEHHPAQDPVNLLDVGPGKFGVQRRAVNFGHTDTANQQDEAQQQPIEITKGNVASHRISGWSLVVGC